MSGHTKGPWQIRKKSWPMSIKGPIHQVTDDKGEFPTAFVPAWDQPKPGEVDGAEEAIANARLIAASPTMLEALEAHDAYMLDAGYSGPESDALHPKAAENWRRVRAAIAKAKGEPS